MEQQPWFKKLLRMKWLMATLTIIVIALNRKLKLGLSDQDVQYIVYVACAWILAEGGADAAGAIGKVFGKPAQTNGAADEKK